jgi:Xylose isomerase-like TIM barrel
VSLPPIGYSSNLHAAETIDELEQVLRTFTANVRERVGWNQIGLDLRLGSTAIRAMTNDRAELARVRRALDAAGASAHTLNAFPLRPFQASVVKANAYHPDWTTDERLNDTVALIDVALTLSDSPLITISTVPGSYRPFGPAANDHARIARALGQWAAHAVRAEQRCGRRVVLCLEPEPWCLLETSHDVVAFWHGALAEHGVAAAADILDRDITAGERAIKHHLAICFDTCHFSLAFEDQLQAVTRLQNAGIAIAKCQFSAAPEVRQPLDDNAGLSALRALAEPRFMHQTAAYSAAGSLSKVQDLDQLDLCLARLPNATAVRSHFHLPVFRPAQPHGLSTTIEDSHKGLSACLAAGCTHIAVETYTWSILAAQEQDVLNGTVRELLYTQQAVIS